MEGRRTRQGAAARQVTVMVDAVDHDIAGGEPVFEGDRVVGVRTSGGYGHATGLSLGFAYVDSGFDTAGTTDKRPPPRLTHTPGPQVTVPVLTCAGAIRLQPVGASRGPTTCETITGSKDLPTITCTPSQKTADKRARRKTLTPAAPTIEPIADEPA